MEKVFREKVGTSNSTFLKQYTPTGNISSCFFYSGGVNFLMQLQFLAPVELFFKQLKRYSFRPGRNQYFFIYAVFPAV